jgi:hypothetical protein
MLDEIIETIKERRKQVDIDITYLLNHRHINSTQRDELAYMMDTIDDIYYDIECVLKNIEEGNV